MHIDVKLIPNTTNSLDSSMKTVVIVDVLRATSTIVTALANRCDEIIPTSGVEEALSIAAMYNKEDIVLGGERRGEKVEGFKLGNSPCEYLEEVVKGKKLILATTNGTRTIKDYRDAENVFVASFLNAKATVDACINAKEDVLIICSGQDAKFALEDSIFAGLLVEMIKERENVTLSDSAIAALYIKQQSNPDIYEALRSTDHGSYLESIGYGKDLLDCSKVSTIDVVAKLSDGRILRY